MKKLLAAAVLVALSATPVLAQDTAAQKGKGVADITRVTATVEAVDQKTRSVTLKRPDGEKVTFTAGPEVRNLAQLAVGDLVTVEYGEAVAMRLAKTAKTKPERTISEAMERAQPGQKPGGVAVREVKVVAAVTNVDTAKSTITLKGVEHTVELKVRDPEVLKGVKVGDYVEASYTEAVAIKVTSPTKKEAPAKK